ncbi:D-alanyl-D-alanine carboxypeptidase family protein [Maricaulaceae bacterium MS644]
MVARALALLLMFCAALTAPAVGQERYAAFVADMDSGEVLHAVRDTAQRHPASLTKMMTLYMLFDAVERGELTLESPLAVSAEAASRPASKLGVRAGTTISVEDAIRALIIQSANDVAVVVAEALAADEAQFAAAMTARAAGLGLTATRFNNASGLPDAGQITTARDMARLAFALRRDFPQFFHYFSEIRFRWGASTHTTHNSLVGRVEGVTGLKTGYIRASGFNIAVTAERSGRPLVAVVMGGASSGARDAHARELIEAAYTAMEARDTGVRLAALNIPRLNPIREQETLTAELAGMIRPTAMGSAGGGAPPARVAFAEDVAAAASSNDAAPIRLATAAGWSIQVGAYASEIAARARLDAVAQLGVSDLLQGASPFAQPLESGQSRLWRARYAGLSADTARAVCERLSRRGEPCFTVAPNA